MVVPFDSSFDPQLLLLLEPSPSAAATAWPVRRGLVIINDYSQFHRLRVTGGDSSPD